VGKPKTHPMNRINDLKINRLQHIGIPVTDKDISEKFYFRLGFNKIMEEAFEHEGGNGVCLMMQCGEVILELYQMPEKILKDITARSDGHIDHIAFDVSNIEDTYRLMKENGFQVIEEAPRFLKFWKNGCRYFNIIGPDKERIEFNQIL
jgi:lactoylglutathione lyase